jgi:hypothetical protein
MKPEIKALWVAWLRDPKNQQGRGYLNRDGKLCCLGGLCELAAEAGVVTKTVDEQDGGAIRYTGPDTEHGMHTRSSITILPYAVVLWADVYVRDPNVRYDGQTRSLTALNDDERLPFAAIARAIEEDEQL